MSWFTDALDKAKSGMKFLADHVWNGLKSVLGKNAKDFGDSTLSSVKALLATEVGQFIAKVVTELEASALGGPERLAQATTNIKDYLSAQGKTWTTDWIQLAIQLILVYIRGLASQPPAI